jgi:hypothetical protein
MSNIKRNDIGEPLDQYQTKGEYNMYLVGSALQKAIRRGDREVAMFSALELIRSGYEGFFRSRVSTILIEDLRLRPDEAHLLTAIDRLQSMMDGVFADDEGMRWAAAMRIASLMAEAESSRILTIKNSWLETAEERLEAIRNGEEPEHGFPLDEIQDSAEYILADQHVARGSRAGRNIAHYLIEASRVTDPSKLERQYKRRMMAEQINYDLTDEQIEHGTTPVPEDEPWEYDGEIGFPRH